LEIVWLNELPENTAVYIMKRILLANPDELAGKKPTVLLFCGRFNLFVTATPFASSAPLYAAYDQSRHNNHPNRKHQQF